jgi:hypothetical protein
MLHYGRAKIVEAKIDQALGVIRRLNDEDIDWLRENAVTFATDLETLAAQIQSLASAIAEGGAVGAGEDQQVA